MRRRIRAGYFNEEYWTKGTKSGYKDVTFYRGHYANKAQAEMLVNLYGTGGIWLEAGCAYGWILDNLVGMGVNGFGFDISKYAIKNCPDSIRNRMSCHNGLDYETYSEDWFDVIYSFETAEHLHPDDVGEWLTNLHYWMESNGRLFITVCLGNGNIRGLHDPDKSHQTLQPREWWNDLLTRIGFVPEPKIKAQAECMVIDTVLGQKHLAVEYDWNIFAWKKQR